MFYQLTSNSLTVTINSHGAEIVNIKNDQELEFIWQAEKTVWARHAPILFPIVGKLKNDTFVFEEQSYHLSQHGFARDLEFKFLESSLGYCVFELESSAFTKKNYPFDFVLRVRYELKENILTTYYKIINPSNGNLFFSIGAHPGFNCPLLENESFEDYFLEFENGTYSLTQLNSGLRLNDRQLLHLNENKLPLSETLFNNDALVFENNQINKITLRSKKSNHSISLNAEQWPYFGIWAKNACRKFICLEPWYGIADLSHTDQNLKAKQGIIELAPKKDFNCNFSLSFT